MPKQINMNLEALRGYAALFVVFGHLLALSDYFNSGYIPTVFVVFAPSSHLFLLVFFVLSGYVITASHPQINGVNEISTYLKKRFVRIYPIYFVAIVITLLIAKTQYSTPYIFWNFIMMQDLVVPQLLENGPAWSLHFEVLFYLLFVPIAVYRLNFLMVFLLSLTIAFANFYFYPDIETPIISSYFFGFSFWIGGACLAKYFTGPAITVPVNHLLSVLCFLLAIDQMVLRSGLAEIPDQLAFRIFGTHLLYPTGTNMAKTVLGYHDIAFLPYCIYAVLVFSGKKFVYEKIYFALLLLPPIYAVYLVAREQHHVHLLSFMVPVMYFIISVALRFINPPIIRWAGAAVIRLGEWLGGISYGIYIIHAPLLVLVGRISFSGNQLLVYLLKVCILMPAVILSAILLEKYFQPWARKLFFMQRKAIQSL